MSAARLAVVVVNYGSSALLQTNLAPLSRASEAGVVVVDNFSTVEERRRIEDLAAAEGWLLVAPATNEGFGGGMNLGAAAAFEAGFDALLLLNPDAVLTAPALDALADAVLADPALAVSPKVLRPDGGVYFAGSDLHTRDGRIMSPRHRTADSEVVEWLSGACLALSRSLWERIGGFDPEYFLYWEDVDLSWRILASGGRLEVLPDVIAVHDEGGTHREASGRPEAKSTTYYYYNVRNRQLFAAKNLDAGRRAAWRANDIRVAYEILLQGGRRQFLRPWQPVSAAIRGLRDGRRIARALVGAREEVAA